MELKRLSASDRLQWEDLVRSSMHTGFMQSWAWSGFKEQSGQDVLRLGVFGEGRLLAGAIAYSVGSSVGASPLLVPQGPVLPWEDREAAERAAVMIIEELSLYARQWHAPMVRVEPAVDLRTLSSCFPGAARAPIDLVPTPSLWVDVNRTDEEILAAMKPKGRYNIKVAAAKGVETTWGTTPGHVREFYGLFELTCLRHRFLGETQDFFQQLMAYMAAEGAARVYLSRYRGIVTSAAIVIFYGRMATYLYGGSLPFFPQAMASYDLHWTAMRDARAAGCRYYDFYGIAPDNNPRHPYTRFTAFKKKFGGQPTDHAGAHDIILYDQLAQLWLTQMDAMAAP